MNSRFPIETDGQQRRILLKGAFAACCAMVLPSLTGCGKREEPAPPTPSTGTAPPPGPPSNTQNTTPPSSQVSTKLSKLQVQYQEQPKGEQQCSKCMHFIAESSTCKLVEGPINPNGWCTLWALKQS